MRRAILSCFLTTVVILSGACSPAPRAIQPPAQSAAPSVSAPVASATATRPAAASPTKTTAAENPTAPVAPAAPAMEALLAQTLALRQVKISLSTIYPAWNSQTVTAEVDAAGNYHLVRKVAGTPPAGSPQGTGAPDYTELFVVSGAVYGPDKTGTVVKSAVTGLADQLRSLLNGSGGPILWLKVLPKGSLAAQGEEPKGGFQAKKYAVQGRVEGSTITGTIWVDIATGALVAAELDVPGALLSIPSKPAKDPLQVRFQAEKAIVAPITAPAGQAGRAAPTGEPGVTARDVTPETVNSDTPMNQPVVLDHYPIDPKWIGAMNLVAVQDRVWVLMMTGDLVAYDVNSGQPAQALELKHLSSSSQVTIYMIGRLVYDGKYLWALLMQMPTPDFPRAFFRVDPDSGEVLAVDLPAQDPTCDGGCSWRALAVSPGKVWAAGENTVWVFDINDPAKITKIPETGSIGYMVYDNGRMWASVQTAHGLLSSINVDDPRDIITGDCINCSWLVPVNGLIWAGVPAPEGLFAFDEDDYAIDTDPLLEIELQNEVDDEMSGARNFFDGRYFWDKTPLADTLFYYDPEDGSLAGSLSVYSPPGGTWNQRDTITAFDFDGRDVWAVGRKMEKAELIRIRVPWGR